MNPIARMTTALALIAALSAPAAAHDPSFRKELNDWLGTLQVPDGGRLCCIGYKNPLMHDQMGDFQPTKIRTVTRDGKHVDEIWLPQENKWIDLPYDRVIPEATKTMPAGEERAWVAYSSGKVWCVVLPKANQ